MTWRSWWRDTCPCTPAAGLSGGFDLALYFDNRPLPGVGPAGGFTRPRAAEPATPDAVSIFTAGPIEVLVIDHVERPTPN